MSSPSTIVFEAWEAVTPQMAIVTDFQGRCAERNAMIPKKKPPAGAPEWVLTYGDMMSLLLCFFILLAAFADYEKGGSNSKMMEAVKSFQAAMGLTGQQGTMIDDEVDMNTLLVRLEAISTMRAKSPRDTQVPGIQGDEFRVRRIRDGMEIALGGPVFFEPFASQMTPDGLALVAEIGNNLRGHRNMIEIRGHAGDTPQPADWSAKDAWHLSYARAENVANELVRLGVNPRTMRLVAVGIGEPVKPKADGVADPLHQRRVEIIIRESLIEDYR